VRRYWRAQVFSELAAILEPEADSAFAASMTQALNLLLLTAPELADLRARLQNALSDGASARLLETLYSCWCHSACASLSLCMLAQAYTHVDAMIHALAELPLLPVLLAQVDRCAAIVSVCGHSGSLFWRRISVWLLLLPLLLFAQVEQCQMVRCCCAAGLHAAFCRGSCCCRCGCLRRRNSAQSPRIVYARCILLSQQLLLPLLLTQVNRRVVVVFSLPASALQQSCCTCKSLPLLQAFLSSSHSFRHPACRFVMLVDSPVFTRVRLQLLCPGQFPDLMRSMYSLLMLCPQSNSFHTLQVRLQMRHVHVVVVENECTMSTSVQCSRVYSVRLHCIGRLLLTISMRVAMVSKHQGRRDV
jgi:hypothetical protein